MKVLVVTVFFLFSLGVAEAREYCNTVCGIGYACVANQALPDGTYGDKCVSARSLCLEDCPAPGVCEQEIDESWSCKLSPDSNSQTGLPACADLEKEYTNLTQQCDAEVQETGRACDEKQDAGMNNVTNMASQLALSMGQQASSSIQGACSKMANLSQAANAAVAAYRLNCSTSISSCNSACSSLKGLVEKGSRCTSSTSFSTVVNESSLQFRAQHAEEMINKCNQFQNKVNEASQAISNLLNTGKYSSTCADLTSGTAPAFCEANPAYPGCSPISPVDCNDPTTASTNKVCICKKNPMNPECSAGSAKVEANANASAGQINSSSRTAGDKLSGDSFGGDLPNIGGLVHGTPSSGGGHSVDGNQGGGGNSIGSDRGSSGASAYSGGSGGETTDADGIKVTNGFYGGSSAPTFGSGGASSSGVQPSGSGGAMANPKGPDLRKFLPGGTFDPKLRGMAGSSGLDGITGPHSNIWQKIQNRYRVLIPSLLP